jgi:cytochrome c oxidase subunit 4
MEGNTHAGTSARTYAWIWIYLLAITGVEVVLAYVHLFSTVGMLVVLMVLSIVKAGLIVAYFMHLKFERMTLILSLIPAVVVVISLLFAFFPDSLRLLQLRVH